MAAWKFRYGQKVQVALLEGLAEGAILRSSFDPVGLGCQTDWYEVGTRGLELECSPRKSVVRSRVTPIHHGCNRKPPSYRIALGPEVFRLFL